LTAVSSKTHATIRRTVGGVTILGIATALAACGSSGTPSGSSSSGVITTISGNETCAGRPGQNDGSPDAYRQQYSTGLAKELKSTISTYEAAVQSGDSQQIADAAGALAAEIRADAHLVTIPRLYGCYNPKVLASLQKSTDTLATTLDALSCAGVNMCNRNQAEVPRLLVQEKPQERSYVEAINTYAAQFGGEQLALPPVPTT
jgi:hypothetical protein